MKNKKLHGIDFVIDRLTNSIENIITGDSFQTMVSLFTMEDAKHCTKKNGWNFDWKFELKQPTRDVFKLTIANSISAIQGLISLEVKEDHVFIHLIENAPFNKGKSKVYAGVAGNLVAYACKVSVDKGYQGFLAFDAKTALIKHYKESLYATHFRELKMFIETNAAMRLISQYFES